MFDLSEGSVVLLVNITQEIIVSEAIFAHEFLCVFYFDVFGEDMIHVGKKQGKGVFNTGSE
ncbi:hypothetical protein [Enterobacter sp. 168J2]|uniref:hypothetical protein n=1 Tax=Enterobacter sp. 168J2 TaxID=3077758 RepID=UPI00124A5F33|nr:hypothetical protein [Enterobacter sp. 168J2]MCP1112471.1 hypothetical protein [Enterobacter bugandensis]HBU6133037.1 hypothetical protein [Enterobacter cloacae]